MEVCKAVLVDRGLDCPSVHTKGVVKGVRDGLIEEPISIGS